MKYLVLLTCIFLTNFLLSQADEDTSKIIQTFVITKTDGTEYIGKILKDDGREVLVETEALGKIYIPKSSIKSIVKIEDENHIKRGEYSPDGPFTTRYAFTTNALPIKKGEDYAMINLYGPEVHFAVTDNLNLGIMTTWIGSPLLAAFKYSFKTGNENINFSIGTLFGTTGYLNNFRGYGGLHFANVTFGDRRRNLTLAGGFAYLETGSSRSFQIVDEGDYIDENSYFDSYNYPSTTISTAFQKGPIFSIAGFHKVGARATFVFDSMIGIFDARPSNEVVSTELSPALGEPWEVGYQPGEYRHRVTINESKTIALFFMPGMRFQKDEKRAFQVSIAGVSVFSQRNNFSFPMPMCSWFFKF